MLISVNKNIIPFFSVVITSYNRAYILKRALNSVMRQTTNDWECLIIDDGSSDNTYQIAKEYCDKDKRFRYLYHSNRKQSASKNAGLLAAGGVFVTFLDSDDEYEPEHLDIRRRALYQYSGIELLHGGIRIEGDEYVPDRDNPKKKIHLSECVIGGTFFIEKFAGINIGGFPDVDYGDDTAFFDKAVENGLVIGKIDIPTYIYHRESTDSLCNTIQNKL